MAQLKKAGYKIVNTKTPPGRSAAATNPAARVLIGHARTLS
jgi:hypothetical protein